MALTGYNQYLEKLQENRTVDFQMTNVLGRNLRMTALWRSFAPAPSFPTASVALNKDSAESLGPVPATSGGQLTMLGARLNASGISGIGLILIDLLNVSGGLDSTVTTQQTTNLPTAALTRHTSGEGVMAAIIIHSTIGTTASSFTVSYTNQAGVSGRISTTTSIGASGFREGGALLLIPLAAGDTGIRSVESVTLAGTTGAAGNFGVCLFKPLTMLSLESTTGTIPIDSVSTGGIIGAFPVIDPNACLSLAAIANAVQLVSGVFMIAEV